MRGIGRSGQGLYALAVFGAILLLQVAAAGAARACHHTAVLGPVVLTVDGLIQDCEGQFEVKFDLSSLRALPAEEVLTRNPWEKTKVRYRGVLLRDLVTAVGGHGAVLRIEALDDYHSALDVADAQAYDILLAYEREGQTLPVRDKGPLFVVFPFTDVPALETQGRYAQSVWQVSRITIK